MAAQQGVVRPGTLLRPPVTADFLAKSALARVGIVVALMGIMLAMAPFVGSLVNADLVAGDAGLLAGAGITNITDTDILSNNAWTFGVAVTGFAMLKIGIALILLGILRRLWIRVESVKAGLPALVPDAEGKAEISSPRINTPYGRATFTQKAPKPLLIHRMSYVMGSPMVLMGIMAVGAGLGFAIVQAIEGSDGDLGNFRTYSALSQGTLFLGEALILSGIAFILGSILGSLRQGGGEVQETLGMGVKTPVMPFIVKAFLGLMMTGLMLAMVQFGFYLFVASEDDPTTINAFFAWLGPLRKVALATILSGIVLALAAIGTKVLPFQFWRIQELIKNGR